MRSKHSFLNLEAVIFFCFCGIIFIAEWVAPMGISFAGFYVLPVLGAAFLGVSKASLNLTTSLALSLLLAKMAYSEALSYWIHWINFGINASLIFCCHLFAQFFKVGFSEKILFDQRFLTALDATPNGMILINRSGNIVQANSIAHEMFGYPPRELIGMSIDLLVPLDIQAKHRQHRKDFFKNPTKRPMGSGRELFGRRNDNTEFPVEIGLQPLISHGETYVMGTVVDISDAIARRAFIKQLMDHSGAAFFVKEMPSGRYLLVNNEYERIFGVSEDAVTKKENPRPFLGVHAHRFHQNDQRVFQEKRTHLSEFSLPTPNGSLRTYLFNLFPLLDGYGKAYAVGGVATDITSIKETEKELERSNQELLQFANIVSHDLKAPIRHVNAYTNILLQELSHHENEQVRNSIEVISRSVQRMKQMISDLLELSRVGVNKISGNRVDMNEVVQGALEHLEERIQETQATIDVKKLPSIVGDSSRLLQVYQNLIENALKFSKKGEKPFLQIGSTEGDHSYTFYVKDSGVGMEEVYLQKIFQIFQRGENARSISGSGVGLALCKKIIELHGGTIWAESKMGQGSSFFFELPKNSSKSYAESKE